LNRYTYVLDNPCSLVDPLGLTPQCTLFVHVDNAAGVSPDTLSEIEQQVNNLFGAAGVGVDFQNNNGPVYQLTVDTTSGDPALLGSSPLNSSLGTVFVQSITTGYDAWAGTFSWGWTAVPDWLNSLNTVIGTVGAHEMYRAVANLPDITAADNSDIMGVDNLPGPSVYWSAHLGNPALHFSTSEAAALMSACKNKLPNAPVPQHALVSPDISYINDDWLEQLFILWTNYVEPPAPPDPQLQQDNTSKIIYLGECIGGSGCSS
jgi:hypothetical protein